MNTTLNTWQKSKNLKRLKTKSDDICQAISYRKISRGYTNFLNISLGLCGDLNNI